MDVSVGTYKKHLCKFLQTKCFRVDNSYNTAKRGSKILLSFFRVAWKTEMKDGEKFDWQNTPSICGHLRRDVSPGGSSNQCDTSWRLEGRQESNNYMDMYRFCLMLEKDSLISPLIKWRPVCPMGAKDWVLMILMLIHVKHLCYLRI